jgi:uncharacterized protein YjiS (DUF1127 family)
LDTAWGQLNDPRRFERAAQSTVEALVFELRENGAAQLEKANCRRRLSELSDEQLREVIGRLMAMQPQYLKINDALIAALRELQSD